MSNRKALTIRLNVQEQKAVQLAAMLLGTRDEKKAAKFLILKSASAVIENEKKRRMDEHNKTQESTNEVSETVQVHSEGVSSDIESPTIDSGEQEPQEV
jgi:hypothetical protein